jgi:hypothetical protein
MRFKLVRDGGAPLLRVFGGDGEIAYATLGISGLQAEIEFPSDWHEERRAWVRFGLGIGRLAFSFPWSKTVPDEFQCSGPTYGFQFYEDLLWIRYGKDKGTRSDPRITFHMPWAWKHRKHEVLSQPETHPYTYTLRSGEVQHRTATIKSEQRTWTRWWIPFRRVSRSIDIDFNSEVGERTGSWKGGVLGCGYEMKPGETPLHTLRRMEAERKF